uniref:Uncharacterized protein n=1 Tax=Arundo donax TaxID=35708 RepID=A0A0A9AVE7_ARUDO
MSLKNLSNQIFSPKSNKSDTNPHNRIYHTHLRVSRSSSSKLQ